MQPGDGDAACGRVLGMMRTCVAGLFGLLMLLIAHGAVAESPCPASRAQHLELRATRNALAHGRPITIVAFGSSSTEGVGASAPDRAYPARLEAWLRMNWPGAAITVLNRGIGGQTTDTMLSRLDADVLAVKPTLVIWQDGANAALRGVDPGLFGTLLDEGTRRILASGADLVLMDNQIAPKMERVALNAVYGEVLAREAAIRHVSLFSRTALMRDWGAADPSVTDMIGADGLHHTDRGYACIAASLGQAITDAVAKPFATVSAGSAQSSLSSARLTGEAHAASVR